jgi:hypothetical protein
MPTSADVLPESSQYAVDTFHRVKHPEVRYVVGGPRQSGKTTLIYLQVSSRGLNSGSREGCCGGIFSTASPATTCGTHAMVHTCAVRAYGTTCKS